MISRRTGVWVLVGFTMAVAAAAVLAPRIPQSQSYHDFADHRALLGIANFGDVASNLLFAVNAGSNTVSAFLIPWTALSSLSGTPCTVYVVLFGDSFHKEQ